jgi:phosphate starvation-inducible PhoH-like protein
MPRPAALSEPTALTLTLEPEDNERLANLCGPFDEHLREIELRLGITLANRGNVFQLTGDPAAIRAAERLLRVLYDEADDRTLSTASVTLAIKELGAEEAMVPGPTQEVLIRTRRGVVKGRGANQKRYLQQIATHDMNFGVGPAGTGKTYLAVASAVEALERNRVQRILLVRPAVEAGEKLGFLPGDLSQKVDPYLRPLYDALYEMLGIEKVARLLERNVIEIAPLAFMRGRTLNDAFVILDEAQNTTAEQMKMFLTRIGFGSTAVVTGDLTQIDLPRKDQSGLHHAIQVLRGVEGVSFTFFDSKDVVRHPLVARIIQAYEQYEAQA